MGAARTVDSMGSTGEPASDGRNGASASAGSDRASGGDAGGEGPEATVEDSLPDETPPGPDGWPVVGNTIQFVRDPWAFYDVLAGYGDVASYEIARLPFVTVLHPDLVERVLVTESDAFGKALFEEFGGTARFAPEGVLLTEGEQWRAQRTILQNAFTLDRVRRYGESMVDVAAEHVAGWDDGETVALNRRYSELTLDVLSRTLLDVELGDRGDVVTRVADALNDRADSRRLSTYLPAWVPTPSQRRYDRAMADFEDLVADLVAERRGARDADERDDLLSVLLSADGPDGYTHSDPELRDQLLTFLFAGHETTSLALTYTSLLLSEHPDVLAELHREWDEVIGEGLPEPTDVPELEYTDRVLRESLRLYPPAYVVFRQARRDVELGGYRIPEGTYLTLPQFRLHGDERFYDDPEAFDPDRWSDDVEADLPEYAYFPFGGGPRHCIGMRFAMVELTLVLPTVLRSVDLELVSDPDPELRVGATAQPAEDVRALVHERR